MDFIKRHEKAILLIILLGALAVRLININTPLLDHHSWRQTETATMARNFYEGGFRFLYPQVNWAGRNEYVETECPIFTFLIALLYKLFGASDVLARLVAVAFSIGAIFILYLLVKKHFDILTALLSTILFSFLTYNVYFSRTVMPESTMVFFSLATIYFFSKFLDSEQNRHLALSGICAAAAFLVKIPTLYLFIPLCFMAYQKYGWKFLIQKKLWFVGLMAIIPSVFWYYHAYQIGMKSGVTFGIWDWGSTGCKWANLEILSHSKFYKKIVSRLWKTILTESGCFLFLLGFIFGVDKVKQKFFRWWVYAILLYFLIVAHGNLVHDYYQFPLIPLAMIFIGRGLSFFFDQEKIIINSKKLPKIGGYVLGVILLCSVLILNYDSTKKYYKQKPYIYQASILLKELASPEDLIIVLYDGPHLPEVFYYSHLLGWGIRPEDKSELLESYQVQGAKYLVCIFEESEPGAKRFFQENPLGIHIRSNYKLSVSEKNFYIFNLV